MFGVRQDCCFPSTVPPGCCVFEVDDGRCWHGCFTYSSPLIVSRREYITQYNESRAFEQIEVGSSAVLVQLTAGQLSERVLAGGAANIRSAPRGSSLGCCRCIVTWFCALPAAVVCMPAFAGAVASVSGGGVRVQPRGCRCRLPHVQIHAHAAALQFWTLWPYAPAPAVCMQQ